MRFHSNGNKKSRHEDIEVIENHISCYIPCSYKVFLLNNKCGKPFKTAIQVGTKQDYIVDIYSCDCFKDYDFDYWGYPDEVGYIYIAHTIGGNVFLMSVSEDQTNGMIYYWDHDLEPEGADVATFTHVQHVANNINIFLDLLKNK